MIAPYQHLPYGDRLICLRAKYITATPTIYCAEGTIIQTRKRTNAKYWCVCSCFSALREGHGRPCESDDSIKINIHRSIHAFCGEDRLACNEKWCHLSIMVMHWYMHIVWVSVYVLMWEGSLLCKSAWCSQLPTSPEDGCSLIRPTLEMMRSHERGVHIARKAFRVSIWPTKATVSPQATRKGQTVMPRMKCGLAMIYW